MKLKCFHINQMVVVVQLRQRTCLYIEIMKRFQHGLLHTPVIFLRKITFRVPSELTVMKKYIRHKICSQVIMNVSVITYYTP